jgi:hypothetical protein
MVCKECGGYNPCPRCCDYICQHCGADLEDDDDG